MHFRTVKETRKLRGFCDLFMLNRRLIIIIILIIGKVFYYYLFIIIYYLLLFILLLLLFCFYFWGAVIKRYAKFLTRYVKGVQLVNKMYTKEVPFL